MTRGRGDIGRKKTRGRGDGGKKKKNAREKQLTPKERRFVKSYVRLGNATVAAVEAGYKSKTRAGLRVMASEKLRKLQLPIKELMNRMGLDDLRLLGKLDEGLDALLIKTASHDGKITDQLAYVDFETRREYLDIAFKLRGSYAPMKVEAQVREIEELTPEEAEVVRHLKEELLRTSKGKKS